MMDPSTVMQQQNSGMDQAALDKWAHAGSMPKEASTSSGPMASSYVLSTDTKKSEAEEEIVMVYQGSRTAGARVRCTRPQGIRSPPAPSQVLEPPLSIARMQITHNWGLLGRAGVMQPAGACTAPTQQGTAPAHSYTPHHCAIPPQGFPP